MTQPATNDHIDNLLHEERVIPPPESFVARARL